MTVLSKIISFDYIRNILGTHWTNGVSAEYVYSYAVEILKARWVEFEYVVFQSPKYAYLYIRDVPDIPKECFKQAERAIKRDAYYTYLYTKKFKNGRWKEAEPILMTSPMLAYMYAVDKIKDRWYEAETIIASQPESATLYAMNIIHGPWHQAESVIHTDAHWWNEYQAFIKQ